jgi:cell division protein FtsN
MASQTQFYLQFPDDAAAERIGAQLREEGFDVQVGPSPYGGDGWAAVARIAVADDALEATEARLTELAEAAGGALDGYDKLLR